MTKVGRNDPCSCGSGKKYKYCCLGISCQTNPTETIPWPTFPEDFALGTLLRSSIPFRAFYEAERGRINKPIYWARDSSLPPGINATTTVRRTIGDGADFPHITVVRLRHIPARLEDDSLIAHELRHAVLYAEGFPGIGSAPEWERVASAINSMVHDPLVDQGLHRYQFDLQSNYESEVRESIRQLKNAHAPRDHNEMVLWICNYVSNVLDWELVVSQHPEVQENTFQHWFDARHPNIAAEGQRLLALIRQIGLDTPERMTRLFREIINRYNLGHILVA